MIHPSHGVQIFVATKPVDFRKGHDGLAALVQSHLQKKPFDGAVYLFRAKRADRLKLRQVEVLQGQGKSIADAVRQIGMTQQTYYRWRKEYGGMSRDQLKRLKELETENTRLRRAVWDLTLDKMILTEAAQGNF